MAEPVKHGRPNLPFTTEPEKLWLKVEQTNWLAANVGKYKKSQWIRDLLGIVLNTKNLSDAEIASKIRELAKEN